MKKFPAQDRYWTDTASFIETHLRGQEKIAAPARFRAKLRGVYPYSSSSIQTERLSWAIVPKGKLEQIDRQLFELITETFKPVFANEVFVIFSKRKDIPILNISSIHWVSFQAAIKAYQQDVSRSLSFKVANFEFELSVKRTPEKKLEAIDPAILSVDKAEQLLQTSPVETKLQTEQEIASTPDDVEVAIVEPVVKAEPNFPYSLSSSPAERGMVYLGDHRAMTRTVWGQKIFLDTRDISLTPHLLMEGFWEMWITQFFLSRLQPGMTVLDIGANVGYYSLLAASRVGSNGRVYAFEANPSIFEILSLSVEINGFTDTVKLINKAVYSKQTTLKFYRIKDHLGSSTIMKVLDEFVDDYIEVETVSLDDYFGEQIPKIDLIKIDAEGSEVFIFQGMKRLIESNPQLGVIFEFYPSFVSHVGEEPRQFLQQIESYGFQTYEICHNSMLRHLLLDELLDELARSPRPCELFISRELIQT
jgi:FkbM family methyltransferase